MITSQLWGSLKEIFEPFSFSFGAILVAILNHLWFRYRNRMILVSWQASHQPVASASNHAVFGKIEVMYNGNPADNIAFVAITLTNESNTDLRDVVLNIVFNDGTAMYMTTGAVRGSANQLLLTKAYMETLNVAVSMQAGDPAKGQLIEAVRRRRDYLVPVWNRDTKVDIHILAEPPRGRSPVPLVATDHVGVRLRYQPPKPQVFGENQGRAVSIGFFLGLLAALCLSLVFESGLGLAVSSFLLGSLTTFFGAVVIKAGRQALRLLS